MDASSSADAAGRRKRKSRFSDAVERTDAPTAHAVPTSTGAAATATLDAVAIAKAAAEKIARALPGGIPPALPASAAAATRATGDVDEQIRLAQEKRRRTDQIYQSVQQQMSHIQALLRKPTDGASNSAAPSTFMPAPLLLDEHGRQVDEAGNVIEESIPTPVTTLKLNQSGASRTSSSATTTKQPQNQNPYLSHRTVDKADAVDAVDPRLMLRKRETYVKRVMIAHHYYCCCCCRV